MGILELGVVFSTFLSVFGNVFGNDFFNSTHVSCISKILVRKVHTKHKAMSQLP